MYTVTDNCSNPAAHGEIYNTGERALSLFIGCFLPDIYHVFNSGHAINWDNARVIDTCHHYHTRIFQILESWYVYIWQETSNE